jgi:hypothetical protein
MHIIGVRWWPVRGESKHAFDLIRVLSTFVFEGDFGIKRQSWPSA